MSDDNQNPGAVAPESTAPPPDPAAAPPGTPGGPGGIEGLQNLKLELPEAPTDLPRGKRSKGRKPEPPQPDPAVILEQRKTEASAMADAIIEEINSFLTKRGLSSIGSLQTTIIRTGLIGCMVKYDIQPEIDKYPEILLASGAVWVAYERYEEYKALVSRTPEQ